MAGFLGINKKNLAGGAPKPTAPVKPTIKPIAKAPGAPIVKPAVKAPVAPKAAVKPVVKPIVKPPVAEQALEESTETTTETVAEEVVTLAPTAVETVSEEVETPNIDEATEETNTTEEAVETSETVEVKEEKETIKSDDIPEGYTEEEWLALSPQKRGAITRKLRQDNKKRKEALELHKEELGLNETPVSAGYTPEKVPTRSEIPYEEVVAAIIISSAGAEWDKQVAELTAALKSIAIEPDMNTATMKHAMSELVTLKDTIWSEVNSSKTVLEAVKRKIDMVSILNAKGSSTDERKANALRACMKHTENDITINLYELLDVASAKYNFYSELMKQIDFKAKSLITMNGALKLEKDALGQL